MAKPERNPFYFVKSLGSFVYGYYMPGDEKRFGIDEAGLVPFSPRFARKHHGERIDWKTRIEGLEGWVIDGKVLDDKMWKNIKATKVIPLMPGPRWLEGGSEARLVMEKAENVVGGEIVALRIRDDLATRVYSARKGLEAAHFVFKKDLYKTPEELEGEIGETGVGIVKKMKEQALWAVSGGVPSDWANDGCFPSSGYKFDTRDTMLTREGLEAHLQELTEQNVAREGVPVLGAVEPV